MKKHILLTVNQMICQLACFVMNGKKKCFWDEIKHRFIVLEINISKHILAKWLFPKVAFLRSQRNHEVLLN